MLRRIALGMPRFSINQTAAVLLDPAEKLTESGAGTQSRNQETFILGSFWCWHKLSSSLY